MPSGPLPVKGAGLPKRGQTKMVKAKPKPCKRKKK